MTFELSLNYHRLLKQNLPDTSGSTVGVLKRWGLLKTPSTTTETSKREASKVNESGNRRLVIKATISCWFCSEVVTSLGVYAEQPCTNLRLFRFFGSCLTPSAMCGKYSRIRFASDLDKYYASTLDFMN
jgi:hypothetical protein